MQLESDLVQNVLMEQLKDSNENRYYLMCTIRQLEKNHAAEISQLKSDHADELLALQVPHPVIEAEPTP